MEELNGLLSKENLWDFSSASQMEQRLTGDLVGLTECTKIIHFF